MLLCLVFLLFTFRLTLRLYFCSLKDMFVSSQAQMQIKEIHNNLEASKGTDKVFEPMKLHRCTV